MLRTKKILSVLLVIMMLMQTLVTTGFAAEVSDFTDFPKDSWSTKAMTAAVDNGLLMGTSETTIEPRKNLTRAEFAAIVTRAFGATKTADISNFKDVTADDWFYESVAKVVQMGVMNGTGNTTFDPNAFMKREDVILSLARILFVDGDDTSVLEQFSDRSEIDDWSVKAIAGMVAEDYVHGYEDGTIRPQNYITREELAQLFHNIFRTYISEDGEYDSVARTGSVIVRSKYVTLKDVTINGDLIMADGIGDGDFRISNVHVTGKIIARGGEGMNYFVDVTSGGKVIVNDPNGVVNFYNYRDEDTPFKNDNVIENTPATFLERQKPVGPSLGGSGTVTTKYDFFVYGSYDDMVAQNNAITSIEDKTKSYEIAESHVPTDDVMEAAAPSGYEFKGWLKKGSVEGAKQRDYLVGKRIKDVAGVWYPYFEKLPVEYTITFVTDAGNKVVTKTEGETIDASEIPEITVDESKEFMGWTTVAGSTNVDYTNAQITADVVENVFTSTSVTLYPVIKDKDSYSVIFKPANAGETDKEVKKYDPDYVLEDADVPTDPTKADHTFKGWSKDPAATEGEKKDYFVGKKISEVEGTWYPIFEEILDEYTITFVTDAGNEVVTKTEGETISASEIPAVTAPEGFTFQGWSTVNNSASVEFANDDLTADVVENVFDSTEVTLYPVFQEITITLVFEAYNPLGDGSTTHIKTMNLKWNDIIERSNLPVSSSGPDREFLGWAQDKTATAAEYTNDTLASGKIGAVLNVDSSVTITLYTIYRIIPVETERFTVEFKYTDGSKALDTVTADLRPEDDYVLKDTDVKDVRHNVSPDDYRFLGWTTTVDGTDYLTSEQLRVSIKTLKSVYYAQFEKITNNYSVAFKYTNGQEVLPTVTETLTPSGDYILKDTDVKDVRYFENPDQYLFLGWTTTVDGTDYIASADIVGTSLKATDGTTYYAQFEKLLVVNFIDYGDTVYTFYVRSGKTLADAFDPEKIVEKPVDEISTYLDAYATTGYEKNYDDEYIVSSNYTDVTYYKDYNGDPNAHGHEVNYNWYIGDDESYTPYELDYVFTEEVTDIYSKLKKLNVVISFPEQITGGEKVTLYVPYEDDTRFLDSVRDALYINESSLMRQIELTGVEDNFYDKLSTVGGKFFGGEGLFNDEHEINNTDVMIYFYQMMGGKSGYKKWLWEEVEDAVEAALGDRGPRTWRSYYESLRTSGLNQEQALYEFFVNNDKNEGKENKPAGAPPMAAQDKYWDSAEFIEMSTEEEFFYATVKNDFIMERVEEKISSLDTIDEFISEYVGDKIPAGLLNRLPMDMVRDIYEPRVAKFLDELAVAREAAKNGEPKENYRLDSGILFDINLVEELLIPGMEFAKESHEAAVNKAVSSGNKAAELVEKYYVLNPYTIGDAGNYGVVNYAFEPSLYVEDTDGDGMYSIKSFEDIYNNVVMPESVETVDALLWYMDQEGGAVDFARIRKLAEENEALILALHNHPHKLMAEYAENGLPEDMSQYWDDLLSDPEIKKAVEKLDNKVSFDMMYFVEDKINNATLEMYFIKALNRLGVPAETLLSKYTNSAAFKELTSEDFADLLDDLEYCWATVEVDGETIENANGTTDFVIDRMFEKLGNAGADSIELPSSEDGIKGFKVEITRMFADTMYD